MTSVFTEACDLKIDITSIKLICYDRTKADSKENSFCFVASENQAYCKGHASQFEIPPVGLWSDVTLQPYISI